MRTVNSFPPIRDYPFSTPYILSDNYELGVDTVDGKYVETPKPYEFIVNLILMIKNHMNLQCF